MDLPTLMRRLSLRLNNSPPQPPPTPYLKPQRQSTFQQTIQALRVGRLSALPSASIPMNSAPEKYLYNTRASEIPPTKPSESLDEKTGMEGETLSL